MNNKDKLLSAVIEITSQRDQDALGSSLMKMLTHIVPVMRASLYRILNENEQHILEEVVHLDTHKNNTGKLEYIWRNTPRIIEATDRIKLCITRKEIFWRDNHNEQYSRFLAPIFNNELVIGVLMLESKKKLSSYNNLIRDIIKIYENCLFSLLESERDTLTGLRNRRTFDLQLNRLLEKQDIAGSKKIKSNDDERRHLKKKTTSWLVAMDVDHFKRVNDKFGHVYGDEVLLQLSRLMKKTFRDTDLLFRFGGEEFVVILTATTGENAYPVLDRFRRIVADYAFPNINQVTLSIGYAQINYDDYPLTILDNADRALYFAKDNGRNQVCCYEQLISEGKLKNKTNFKDAEIF